jgi:hypothetical protein
MLNKLLAMDDQHLNKELMAAVLKSLEDSLNDDAVDQESPGCGEPLSAELVDPAQLRDDLLAFDRLEARKPVALHRAQHRALRPRKKVFGIPPVVWYLAAALIGGLIFLAFEPLLGGDNDNAVTLTTADGTHHEIAGGQMGTVAQENGVTVLKEQGNRIVYDYNAGQQPPAPVPRHALQTPADKTCSVVLANGSLISLQELTRVEYPTAFTEDTSNISLAEGGAKFELVKDSQGPVKVEVAGKNIGVAGTAFTIQTANNEVMITGAAFESVKLTKDGTLEVSLRENMELMYDSTVKGFRPVKTRNVVAAGQNSALLQADTDASAHMDGVSRWHDADIICATGKLSRGKSLFCISDEMPPAFGQNTHSSLRTITTQGTNGAIR